MNQIHSWQGELGSSYTERNVIDPDLRIPAFREMLAGLSGLNRILEVGCNRGHNLIALRTILGESTELVGIEPNLDALKLARESGRFEVLRGDTRDLLFRSGAFDLVFTAGVLIHIPQSTLAASMAEIARVSARYVLAIEYFAADETEVPYRGGQDLLWKRDFLACYQAAVPHLTLVRSGYWGKEDGFDRCHWWLLQKEQ
jgi:pseudaminic acid biosynthesis-associated methylase